MTDPTRRLRSDLIQWGNRLLLMCNVGLLGCALWFISTRGITAPNAGWNYSDLVAILLTAIGVLLAIVAMFVAILAIWGYSALKDTAATVAAKEAAFVADRVAREVAGPIAARSGAEVAATDDDQGEALSTELRGEGLK